MNKRTKRLLRWYRANRILYPWRRTKDPYRIWLSEILLQQTRISVVLRFYDPILMDYPTLEDLVRAEDAIFLARWSGIGYYQRARNMLRCAREIMSRFSGHFPSDLPSLLSLPGIGRYTAGALRNLCFGELTPAIDGNTARVLARITNNFHLIHTKRFQTTIERAFLELGRHAAPAEYFQALMELGERICLPQPDCPACPLRTVCPAYQNGKATKLPRRLKKKKMEVYHWYFLILRKGDAFYYVRNTEREFLKDTWLFPDLLSRRKLSEQQILSEFRKRWNIDFTLVRPVANVSHAVTFRKMHGHVLLPGRYRIRGRSGKWLTERDLKHHPTSSVTKKILRAAYPYGLEARAT